MPRKGRIYLTVYPTEEQRNHIQAAAAERKMSVSEFILSRVEGEEKEKAMVAKPDRSLKRKKKPKKAGKEFPWSK